MKFFLGTFLHGIFGLYVQNNSNVIAKPIAKTSFDIYFLFSASKLKRNDFRPKFVKNSIVWILQKFALMTCINEYGFQENIDGFCWLLDKKKILQIG